MSIEHDDVFYLGDHPVVLQHTENPAQQKELGFDIEGVEAFLPLSPKCALYMPCAATSEQIISGYENALSAPEFIRHAKELGVETPIGDAEYLNLAQRVIANSGGLYRSLTEGATLIASPENIENLNYLQCAWAHAAIYSNQKDFAFARRMFSENPQYRSTVNVRLVAFGNSYDSSRVGD